MKLQFVDGRVQVWDDEAIQDEEYTDENGEDTVVVHGGWVEPNEYQADIIHDLLITALQNLPQPH